MDLIGEQDIDSYRGMSYTIQVAIEFLARRWRRQALARSWNDVARLTFQASVPTYHWEWFMWKANSAILESNLPGQPQSWASLLRESSVKDLTKLPELLTNNRDFAIFWILVFPHRLTANTFYILDRK
jgi:hypothetical protein